MSDMNPYADAYREEAEELLAGIEESVLVMEQNPEDMAAVHKLFRAIHTIKGSGAMFAYTDISGFAHYVEEILDKVRAGHCAGTRE